MNKVIVNCDCVDLLREMTPVKAIFADPPDNIGLSYSGFRDDIPPVQYYGWLDSVISWALMKCQVFWLSYNQTHDLQIKKIVLNLLSQRHASWSYKQFIWRYTFGEYNPHDCGSGYRPLIRLVRSGTRLYPDAIKMMSEREKIGDLRASGPRVPDDVWEYSRIQGNNKERRSWHPTQHPEALIERAYLLSCNPMFDTWCDLFLGTGTSMRACKGRVIGSEISPNYCNQIATELGIRVHSIGDFALVDQNRALQ